MAVRRLRHRWDKVEEDLRRSVLEKRPLLHRCRQCLIFRSSRMREDGRWETKYGLNPYQAEWVRLAPECYHHPHNTVEVRLVKNKSPRPLD